MVNKNLVIREDVAQFYKEYINNGGMLSPFNTESCRKYLEDKLKERVESEDVLWLFYHVK